MSPEQIYLTARELVGTPFKHQGRSKGLGVDCIGVPLYVCKKLGLGDFDCHEYPRAQYSTLQQRVESVCTPAVLQPGVLLLFKISSTTQHCGLVSLYRDGLGLIHAWDVAGYVVEHKLIKDWLNKTAGCYGLPSVTYNL
jgi:cell wall-associated NlpC family hydrolase